MAHDVERVEQDRGLRGMGLRGGAKGLPHIHEGKLDPAAFLLAKSGVELRRAGLRAIGATKPDRPTPVQIADHDAVGMTLPNRDLVDADAPRSRRAGTRELGAHVLLVQRLDRIPVQVQLLGDILDRGAATAPADVVGKPLRVERVVAEKVEPLALHGPAVPAKCAVHAIRPLIPARSGRLFQPRPTGRALEMLHWRTDPVDDSNRGGGG